MTYATDNREWLEPYIVDMAQRVGLPHWRLTLSDDDPEDGSLAQVHIRGDSRRATILLRDPDGDMDDLRDSVVHELMHVHLHDMEHVFTQTEDHFGMGIWDILRRNLHNQLEIAVCAITHAWCQTLPLPEIPEQAKEAA